MFLRKSGRRRGEDNLGKGLNNVCFCCCVPARCFVATLARRGVDIFTPEKTRLLINDDNSLIRRIFEAVTKGIFDVKGLSVFRENNELSPSMLQSNGIKCTGLTNNAKETLVWLVWSFHFGTACTV